MVKVTTTSGATENTQGRNVNQPHGCSPCAPSAQLISRMKRRFQHKLLSGGRLKKLPEQIQQVGKDGIKVTLKGNIKLFSFSNDPDMLMEET